MAKETAKKCLLYVGDGGTDMAATDTLSLTVAGSTATLSDSAAGLGNINAGDLLTVVGFATNGSFIAVAKAVAAGAVTLVSPIDFDTREDKTLVAEAVGDAVTVTYEHFSALLGQKSTTYDKSADTIDTTDKNSGNWGSSLAGTVKMSVKVSGQIRFTSDGAHGGWTAVSDAMDAGDTINARLKLDSLGDSYYGPFVATAQSGGGADSDVNGYDFTLSNADRLIYAKAVS